MLTASRKLKALGDGTLAPLATTASQERNYILCHVRRVSGKKEDEEAESQILAKAVKKEVEKKVETPKSVVNSSKISGMKMTELRPEELSHELEISIDVKAIEE